MHGTSCMLAGLAVECCLQLLLAAQDRKLRAPCVNCSHAVAAKMQAVVFKCTVKDADWVGSAVDCCLQHLLAAQDRN